ncbi:dynein axonemal heavy chain 7-like [Hylaeus anthracinus]|uniref:dynein axonemal heavy chain 7-like n=1 Tax=Hylaeus anthracinus TaxID=313031 RepID=UPI0023B8C3CF|nr:dynein axonemal heavy chain 7-like [Hylaeus anthracinus]
MDINTINVHSYGSSNTITSINNQSSLYNKMKTCLKHIHFKEFPIQWETNILDLLPQNYRKKYCLLIQSMLKEVKDIYIKDMQNFVIRTVLSSPNDKEDPLSTISCTNHMFLKEKRAYNYETFRKHHKLLRKNYFLYLEPIKFIICLAQLKLPTIICNFEHYYCFGPMLLNDFQDMITNDIKKSSLIILNQFYNETSRIITETRVLKAVNPKKLPRIMQCMTNVFVQQILNMMMQSINYMLNIMSNGYYCPQIKFQLVMENNQLHISPNMEEIYSMYHSIIDKIGTVAQNLMPLEEWLSIKSHSKYIQIKLPDWYIKESHNKLQIVLHHLFEPINRHVIDMTEEFYPICAPNIKKRILSLTLGNINFDLYLKQIQKYNTYLVKANAIVGNTYYTIGKLEQNIAKEVLKTESYNIVNAFLMKLIKYHQEFNQCICSEFENLKAKSLNVSKDAKSLIELTEYILHASKVLIGSLESKIQNSIQMLSTLLEIAVLSEDHIELNKKTINWLHEIEPVFRQNNTLCEAMKNELEDEMQKRINDLNSEVDNIVPQLSVLDNMDDINRTGEYIEYYGGLLKQVNKINCEMQRINEEETLFKFPETEFPKIIELQDIIEPFHDLIYVIYQWQKDNAVWLDGPFEWLDATTVKSKTLNYFEKIMEMSQAFKTKIKMDLTANKCFKFSGIADDPDPMQQPAPLKLCWQALNDINDFKNYLPLVVCMCNSALQKRHWEEMSVICNFDLAPNAGTSLRKIISFNLMNDIEKYEAISVSANKELELQQKLSKMIKEWNTISFEISNDETSNMSVFSHLNDIELLLEDHFIVIEEMRTSNFVKPIVSTVSNFSMSLVRIRNIIDQWNYIQVLILSLETTFCYPNIEIYLPKESALYTEVKNVLTIIQNKLCETPTFTEINNPIILKSLCDTNEKLEHINQGVRNYIEAKRLCFPRFFFLSDKEIQQTLFESNNLEKLHISVNKCFEGIQKVRINKENWICSIIGDYGEELYLEKCINVYSDHEEKWLIHLENEINGMIRKSILQCWNVFNQTFTYNSIANFPSMVVVCVFQLYWTSKVHDCLTSFNFETLNSLYLKYVTHVSCLINEMKKYSTKRYRDVLMSLIIIISNQKDVIKLLLHKNITRSTDFEWVAQLRYYLEENCVKTSMFNTSISYGCEYNYYKHHIINTTLTDRCFHTLMQAYEYHLYGAITGLPAVGKTTTVQSLAKAIAIQFRTFNCADILSYDFFCQVFKGFISCGAWLCFENFDSLKLELLSMITQNLICIFQAITTNLKIITFEGSTLNMNPTGHICTITNLGSFKYSNLPDNLKILFRTISMMAPDIGRIVEVELFAAGISNSKLLASKLVTLYKILSEQLWCESCNTFNICSAKAVVRSVIYLKRSFPDEDESMLLLRSLIDICLPKLCNMDILIFKNIVHNIFPDTVLLPPDYTVLLNTLEMICKRRFLYIHDVFKLKIIQIFETMYIHQALMIVGNPFVGKTEILHVLVDVLSSLHKQGIEFGVNVKVETVIPGVCNLHRLFGHFVEKSKTWKDGICSKIFRSFSENSSSDKKWIVFDGPLNDVWIESLYTVLDTNKALHLTSGEKMNVTDSVSVIFETMNMINVSPAILSRCGIIYIESRSIDWKPYVKTHINKHNIYKGYEEVLYSLFDWVLDPSLKFIEKYCTSTSVVGQLHCIISTLNLLEMYLKDAKIENTEEKGKTNHFIIWMQVALLLSIIWGLGGNLDMDSHIKFNSFCTMLWDGTNKEYPKPESIKNFDITLPHEGLIQDHFYIFKGIGNWKYWGDLLKSEKVLEIPNCNEIFVSTVNTMKYNHVFLKHIKYKKPFILCGDTSIGKTSLMKNLLTTKLLEEKYVINFFSFTSLDTVPKTQRLILSKLNKIRKGHYGPPKNKLCISFIDDLNVEVNGRKSESILELFRQYHTYNYFYDSDEPEKIFIHDIMFSLVIIGNSKTNICPRFLRYFNLYTMYTPSTDTVFRIFSNVLFTNLKKNLFAADVFSSVTNITNATIDIHNSLIKTLRPIPAKFQYQFSLRDISRVINGCSLIQKESIETKVTFIRLWAHEIWRVFGDRILDNNDKDWLFVQIRDIVKCHFKDSFETAFDYLPKSEKNQITKDSFNDLMFSSFMDTEKNKDKKYEEINSMEKLKNQILFYLNEYNRNFKNQIDIVVTNYVLQCLIRISRIVTTPRNNLLMISCIGSGRKSIMSLVAYMHQQELIEPSLHSSNDFNVWRKDLKTVLQKCGALRKSIIFFLKDKQITDHFLCDISSLLANGEIPDLFSIKERYDIIEMVRLHAQGGNKITEISIRSVMNYFIEQCKNNLHIVICFNSTNKETRSYLHRYPELVKYCTINCYETWPITALKEISSKYVQDIKIHENIKADVVKACVKLYNNAQEISTEYYNGTDRTIHITLSAFLHMLKLYAYLMSKKQKDIVITRSRYLTGLEKLELAAKQVEEMKGTLTLLKPQLELSAQQTMMTMKEVENENATVEGATILVQQEEEIANKKAAIAGRLKVECEADLAVAIPILEDAVAALNTLKPTDITLVKAMKNPPDTVKLVMAAICVMLDVLPDKPIDPVTGKKLTDYWGPSKRILGDMNFLQNLKDYDKDNIPHNIMQVIKKTYMTDNNFKPHVVAKASSAAEGLCKWVRAMVSYDEVAKAVAPKKEKLLTAQRECNEAEAFLNEKRRTLAALNAKLAALNNSLQETLQQKLKLEEEVENCTNKLNKAESLITSLGSEKDRWMECAESLQENYNNLVGDMIISCGIITYMASCRTVFRDQILETWKQFIRDIKIPFTVDYNLVSVLGEENEINHWYLCGLPKHRFSVENAIIMNNSKLWCLFIDSHNQANQWIKKIEKRNDLKVRKLTDSDCVSVIHCSVENGNPMLIENIGETLEILLDPFLLKRIYIDGEVSYLDTGYNIIKYSPDFRLYITTRLFNPQYSPEVFSKLTVIDFSIPNEALQDKLLDLVVFKEKPELHEKFEILIVEDAINKKILKQQEDNILHTLSSTTINILEDETAIKTLDSSKNLTLNVIKKQELSKKLILTKILWPDKIIIHVMQMIENILGSIQSCSPQLKISQSYTESSCLTPLLFILPSCSSLLSLVSTYARTKGYLSKFISLSMSKGQEGKAKFLIQKAQREGGWVFLQNCHTVPHWMIQLEQICENCNISKVSINFRLWLSSYPIKEFPISILQNSIKIVHDYPLNIKETLLNIYQSEPITNKEFFEGCPGKDTAFSKLLFGLCLFHSIIKEKKNFEILGWNVPYDFDHSDLRISAMQMRNLINNTDYVPFDILLYLIGECNYGGKIMDDFDKRSLKYLLNDYCNIHIIEDQHYTCTSGIKELIPQRCEYLRIIEHIQRMPLDLSSKVFGFNKNGAIVRDTMLATNFLLSLSCMDPTVPLPNNQLSQEQILTLINDINDKLHDSLEINELQEKHNSSLQEPIDGVLLREVKLLKNILQVITETLSNLKLAFDGCVPFTDSLKKFTEELYKNKVPRAWEVIQNNITIENLPSYIDNLVKRTNFIKQWMNQGCPKVIWLDTLFFGKMFFSAILTTFSKRYGLPIEQIGFEFEVTTEEEVDVEDVDVYFIRGLHLCGARWDFEQNMLVESSTNVFWQDMPPIRLKCLQNKNDTEEFYKCPVYVSAVRHTDEYLQSMSKNYVISIPLKTDMLQTHWIKCGTALFCHVS